MDRKWAVLVYMVADTGNSFYRSAVEDVTEMTEAKFDDSKVTVVVHADAPSPWLSKSWEVKSGAASELKGLSDECVLEFITDCVEHYPAENYLIVLWGHGEGIDWKQKILPKSPNGENLPGPDKRLWAGSKSALDVAELGTTLKELHTKVERLELKDRDVLAKDRIVLGFDACLMAMVEVYFEIHPYVTWAVAANDEIPDSGWSYREILTWLGENPDKGPEDLAKEIVDKCAEGYSDGKNKSAVSFSACNLSDKFSDALVAAVSELKTKMIGHLKTSPGKAIEAIKEARDFAEDLDEIAYVDLNAFCSKLEQVAERQDLSELGGAANNVVTALKEFARKTDFSAYYPRKYTEHSRAVSICFPKARNLEGSIQGIKVNLEAYKGLLFNEKTDWSTFWEAYWDNSAPKPPKPPKPSEETNQPLSSSANA
jgi:hypothetical protein